MLQIINQNFNQSEKKADNFGALPWKNQPDFWARLFGESTFTIDYENIIIHKSKSEIKISFDQIESLEQQKRYINIKTTDGKYFKIKAGVNADEVANLVFRLANEYNEFMNFMKEEKMLPQIGFAYFIKAFVYRGNPYLRAVEILLKTALDNDFTEVKFEPNKENSVVVSYRFNNKLRMITEISYEKYQNFLEKALVLAGVEVSEKNVIESVFDFNNQEVGLQISSTDYGAKTSFYFHWN